MASSNLLIDGAFDGLPMELPLAHDAGAAARGTRPGRSFIPVADILAVVMGGASLAMVFGGSAVAYGLAGQNAICRHLAFFAPALLNPAAFSESPLITISSTELRRRSAILDAHNFRLTAALI